MTTKNLDEILLHALFMQQRLMEIAGRIHIVRCALPLLPKSAHQAIEKDWAGRWKDLSVLIENNIKDYNDELLKLFSKIERSLKRHEESTR